MSIMKVEALTISYPIRSGWAKCSKGNVSPLESKITESGRSGLQIITPIIPEMDYCIVKNSNSSLDNGKFSGYSSLSLKSMEWGKNQSLRTRYYVNHYGIFT